MHTLEPGWEELRPSFDAAPLQSARDARVQFVSELNSLLRRFRQYETEEEWVRLVLDGARPFAQQLALFSVQGESLHLRGQLNLSLPGDLSFPLQSAAAFRSVWITKDPVTALRTGTEVTEPLSAPLTAGRAHLLAIVNGTRVVAILFAGGVEEPDLDCLELVAGLASGALERQSNHGLHAQIAPVAPISAALEKPAPDAAPTSSLPAWCDLEAAERQLHLRAQRFARVSVAELQLAKPDACRAGREQKDLYVFLAREIDRYREIYRRQFMTIPSMVDYLHLELVKTAGEGDASKLGADYPGPLL